MNAPLIAALTAMFVGLICIVYAVYVPAWSNDVVGPLMVALLVPTYAFASFAMTQRARRSR